MSRLRRLLRSCVEPVRRALGTHAIAQRLDAVEQQLRLLEGRLQRPGERSDDGAGEGPFRFVTLPLPGGDSYQLALPRGAADAYHREIEANGAQTETWRFVIDWVRPGDVVVDMGANIGAVTIPLAKRGARVYAFELLQENARALAAAVERNEQRDVSIVIAALRQGAGCVAFGGYSAWGAVVETGPLLVATMAIDDYVEWMQIPRVDFLKIDIEGSEKAALAGAQRLLTRDSPDLLFESNAWTCGLCGYSYRELMATLGGCGYRLYRIYGRRLCPVAVTAVQEVVLTDYFATTKSEEEVRRRADISVSPMTVDEVIESIVSQDRENDLHKGFVVANADRLDSAVAGDPRVSALLAQWDRLRSESFFETLRIGST